MGSLRTRRPRPRAAGVAAALLAAAILAGGCTSDQPLASGPQFSATGVPAKASGTVEIVWPGGKGRVIPPGEEKVAFAEVTVFSETDASPARGVFIYRVLNADATLHREIIATITDAVVDPEVQKAWMLAVVVSDMKICSGSGACDGHDGGEGGCGGSTGGCSDDEGGCSGGGDMGGGDMGGGCGDDTGGCSGDESDCSGGGDMGAGGMGGGCGDDTGGCSGDDGSCAGGDDMSAGCSGGGEADGCSGDGHTGGVGGVPGHQPRVGQILALRLHDRGTPAFSDDGNDTNDDGITWKWFLPGNAPGIDTYLTWSHLCKKTIIGGNLVIHSARP